MEFGTAGAYWERIGWRVDVGFTQLRLPIRPSENMAVLRALLPRRYAPLRPDGARRMSRDSTLSGRSRFRNQVVVVNDELAHVEFTAGGHGRPASCYLKFSSV
jgi:hypothetical protein